MKLPESTLHNFLSFKVSRFWRCPCSQQLRAGIPDRVLQWRGRITDFLPRSRQFPKIRQWVFQHPRVIRTLSNGPHFALTTSVTLRIESGEHGRTLKLIGRIQAEHLDELRRQIAASAPSALELKEVMLVDADAVRFLGNCETEGIELLNCSAYVREWIARERENA